MNDNTQDRSRSQGQQGIDKDTERRNRENETGQQQGEKFGEQGTPSGQDRSSDTGRQGGPPSTGESAFGQPGQSAGGDTDIASRGDETDRQDTTGLGSSTDKGRQGDPGFVGTSKEDSSDYLTKEPKGEGQDFAKQGQGAQDTSAGKSDIETGQSGKRDASLDDGSSGNR